MSPLDVSSSPNQRWLAKEFASSLEQTHRSTRYDVHGYVEFASHLAETEGPEPDPEFCAALRHRLLHELIEDELLPRQDELAIRRDERTRRKGGSHCFERAPREPWIAAASTVLVVCGGALGLGQESSQALPGDSLYPVKRFFESGEMAVANSPAEQARELMEQASERLDEARHLVNVDEIHAQQAVPATIVDFNEATADAGELVVESTHVETVREQTLVVEFRSFSSQALVALDEIAASADDETMGLIATARSTLEGIEQQLPVLDPILDAAEDASEASGALDLIPLGGQDSGHNTVLPDLDSSSVASVPISDDADSGPVDATDLTGAVDDALAPVTDQLQHSVSVVELAASDTVSMAVATVNNTVETVDRTVQRTLETTRQTVERTVEAVDKTVQRTVEAVDKTVRNTTVAVQQTVDQTTQSVQDTVAAVSQATDTLQQATDVLQQQPTTNGDGAADSTPDPVGDTLQSLQNTTGGLLSGGS